MPYTPINPNGAPCIPECDTTYDEGVLEVGSIPICLHVMVGRDYIPTGPSSAAAWKPSKKELDEVREAFKVVKNVPVVVTHTGVHVKLLQAPGVQYGRR